MWFRSHRGNRGAGRRDALLLQRLSTADRRRALDGREAAAIGLALMSVPLAQLYAAVDVLAQQIAANSLGSVAAYKALYGKAQNVGLDEGLRFERTAAFEIGDRAERQAAMVSALSKSR